MPVVVTSNLAGLVSLDVYYWAAGPLGRLGGSGVQLEEVVETMAALLESGRMLSEEAHGEEQLGRLSSARERDSRMHCCKTRHLNFPMKVEVAPRRISPEFEELLGCPYHQDRILGVALPLG
jgi:hypothetical protein